MDLKSIEQIKASEEFKNFVLNNTSLSFDEQLEIFIKTIYLGKR